MSFAWWFFREFFTFHLPLALRHIPLVVALVAVCLACFLYFAYYLSYHLAVAPATRWTERLLTRLELRARLRRTAAIPEQVVAQILNRRRRAELSAHAQIRRRRRNVSSPVRRSPKIGKRSIERRVKLSQGGRQAGRKVRQRRQFR